MKEPPMRLFDP